MHGSLVNRLYENSKQPEPKVGDAATVTMYSDRDPATVVEVLRYKSGQKAGQVKGVVVQYDDWKVVSGGEHDGSARYEYTRNPNGFRETFKLNKKGQFVGRGNTSGLAIGTRERYYDPTF